ncbi:hypothetical protein MAAFP003_86 [Mycobacterium ahvazicum]|uniref:Uncharacterized protein n=1 Tax=Mycobacterium ahvazicum TaxID=1964395 RepID=A0A2K4Y3S5_9MYCO|nr:hypothetical protein MAAFP003_86 [Mycobacterium ahvazicum]
MFDVIELHHDAEGAINYLDSIRERAPRLDRLTETLPRANGVDDSW